MNTSGEAADQVVRMSLEVGEAALKISGTGAKHLCSYIDIMAYKPGITLNDETRGQYQYCLRVFFI